MGARRPTLLLRQGHAHRRRTVTVEHQPLCLIAHNGEINTILGNRAAVRGSEAYLREHAARLPWDGSLLRPAATDVEVYQSVLEEARGYLGGSFRDLNRSHLGTSSRFGMYASDELADLSAFDGRLDRFLRQRFAEVTNPPIDPCREGRAMSLVTYLGTKPDTPPRVSRPRDFDA